MPAKDLGNKFVCFKCSTKFYDLKKPAPVCPKCGTDQRELPVVTKPGRKAPARVAAAEVPDEPIDESDEVEDEAAEEEEEEP